MADENRTPFKYKELLERVKTFDWKKYLGSMRSFKYKDPESYKKLFSNKRFLVGLGICIFIIFVVKGCSSYKPKERIQPRPVQTGLVVKKDVPIYIESFGTLVSIYDVDIVAQVTGKILECHFEEGKEVAKGAPLFTIDPREYKAALDKAEAALAEDLADLQLKKDNLERNKSLIEKELISKQEFERYQTSVAAAEAKVQADRAAIEQAKIDLDYCYINSPIDGLVGKRQVDPGNIVQANGGPTLINVRTVDPFNMDFTISEKHLPKVRNAMQEGKLKIEIWPEGDDGGPYDGELQFIDNTVDELTGTVLLRAVVPNKERKLWAGQFAKVKLILYIQKDAVLAPYKAVRVGQKGPYLFVVKKNQADLRELKTGQKEEDYIIVTKGVSPGEKVVTVGQLGLSPGMPVIEVDPDKDSQKDGKQGLLDKVRELNKKLSKE